MSIYKFFNESDIKVIDNFPNKIGYALSYNFAENKEFKITTSVHFNYWISEMLIVLCERKGYLNEIDIESSTKDFWIYCESKETLLKVINELNRFLVIYY